MLVWRIFQNYQILFRNASKINCLRCFQESLANAASLLRICLGRTACEGSAWPPVPQSANAIWLIAIDWSCRLRLCTVLYSYMYRTCLNVRVQYIRRTSFLVAYWWMMINAAHRDIDMSRCHRYCVSTKNKSGTYSTVDTIVRGAQLQTWSQGVLGTASPQFLWDTCIPIYV